MEQHEAELSFLNEFYLQQRTIVIKNRFGPLYKVLNLSGSVEIIKVPDFPLEVLLISVLVHPLTEQSEDFLDLLMC